MRAFPPTPPDLAMKNSRRSSRRSISTGPVADVHDYRRNRQGSDATAYVDSYLNNFMVSRINNEGLKMPTDDEDQGIYRSWQPFVRGCTTPMCGGDSGEGRIEGKIII